MRERSHVTLAAHAIILAGGRGTRFWPRSRKSSAKQVLNVVGDRSLIRRVLIPGAAPEIAETLRMVLGWAWTYVIVAELIGASSGIGHMITDSQALLATDQIIFGIIVIGLIGLASDLLFKRVNRGLFPWAQLGR